MTDDLRQAVRGLRAMPLVAAVVVASLGLGIGANTTVFSWLQMVRWKPLPGVTAASTLQVLEMRAANGVYLGTSWPVYRDLAPHVRTMEWLIAARSTPVTVGAAPAVTRAAALLVSGNYFDALKLRAAAGRLLTPDDAAVPGGQPVAVIAHDYWRTQFGADPAAVGRRLRVNGRTVTVVGVAPARFQGTTLGLAFDLWLPATMAGVLVDGSRELVDRSQRGYTVIGRLRDGATAAAARHEIDARLRDLAATYPGTDAGLTGELHDFSNPPRGPQRMITGMLGLLQGLMLLVLLAVCGNVANLLLARASVRQHEFGVRLALGAARGRIARIVLLEALLLASAGTWLGVAVALWGTHAVRAGEISGAMPIRFQTGIDAAGLALAIALGIASASLAAVTPAWLLTRMDPQAALRHAVHGASRNALRETLMGVQVALALLVLVAAGLFVQRAREGSVVDPGFRAEGVQLAAYDRTGRDGTPARNRQFAARVLEALRAIPGVESAALASSVPLDIHGLPSRAFRLEGRAEGATPERVLANVVTPGYLATMGIPLVAGSDFAPLDDVDAAPQAIVNEAFVTRYAAGATVIGRRLISGDTAYAIVGVARTSTSDAFGEAPTPLVLHSYRDRPLAAAQMHVRVRPGTESAVVPAIRAAVAALDPTLPVFDVRTLPEHIARNLVLRRVPARMFLVLGPLLLALAAIGVYAVVDYAVSQRTTEIAVRLALGASPRRVARRIVGETLAIVAIGAGAAFLPAVAVDLHVVRGGMRDVPVLLVVPLLLLAVAAAAAWLPARRAALVSPAQVLRSR